MDRNRLLRRALVPAAVVSVATAVAISPALGAKDRAPERATIVAKTAHGGGHFVFAPGVTAVRSGGVLRLRNRNNQEHTVSLVRKRDLPQTRREFRECFAPGGICQDFFVAHGGSETSPPDQQRVNRGDPGFDRPGDSVILPPNSTTRVRVTANRGKRLNYFCAIHPEMQGRIDVD